MAGGRQRAVDFPRGYPMKAPEPNSRIDLIDALRGSALAAILLLHAIEHWDFYRAPDQAAPWLAPWDRAAHDGAFFLFSGKAYALFALMFGVSFCLILDRWTRRGVPFQGRFLWRLAILAGFGYLNGIVYCGDILLIIAVLGVPLVWLHRLGSRVLAWLAVALLLQLPSLVHAARVLLEPALPLAQPRHWAVYGRLFELYATGSLPEVLRTNAWYGQASRLLWTVETGRYTQMLGLFVCGLLLGRARVLEDRARALRLARHALVWGLVGFACLVPVQSHLSAWGLDGLRLDAVNEFVSAQVNLAGTAIWLGLFILLYLATPARAGLALLAPYGRLSLSGYVTQGLIGVPLFYGYGLAWYHWAGPLYSVGIGLGILALQLVAAHLWLRAFVYGPLEWLWRSLTFLNFSTPMRRSPLTEPSLAVQRS